jgi:hypothetical protein
MAKERVGFTMKLLPPKRAVVKIMNSGNAHIFIQIRIGPKKNHEEIVIGTSPMWGGGEPPSKERVSSSSDVLARDMFFLGGVDYSGRDPKGNRWREISIGGESIYYQDISEKTAAYFDQIINSMCIDTTNAPPYFRNRYSVVDESH